jgi:hypothetical protein
MITLSLSPAAQKYRKRKLHHEILFIFSALGFMGVQRSSLHRTCIRREKEVQPASLATVAIGLRGNPKDMEAGAAHGAGVHMC